MALYENMKVLVGASDDRILGFTMIGAEAGEVLAAVQMTMLGGAALCQAQRRRSRPPDVGGGTGLPVRERAARPVRQATPTGALLTAFGRAGIAGQVTIFPMPAIAAFDVVSNDPRSFDQRQDLELVHYGPRRMLAACRHSADHPFFGSDQLEKIDVGQSIVGADIGNIRTIKIAGRPFFRDDREVHEFGRGYDEGIAA